MKNNNAHLTKAFSMFSKWVTGAKIHFPDLNYQIKDANLLKEDLDQAIKKAIVSLINEDKAEKRKQLGYDYGFIVGFIQGNLNAAWHNEYIQKQTNHYKKLVVIRVLETFFTFNEVLKLKLSSAYSAQCKDDLNLEHIDIKIGIDKPNALQYLDVKQPDNDLLAALEGIKIDLLQSAYCGVIPDFLSDLKSYFTAEEVFEILS